MYNTLRQEDYELAYSAINDDGDIINDNDGRKNWTFGRRIHDNGEDHNAEEITNTEPEYCFENTLLYYYMVYSFQYFVKEPSKYRSIFTYRLFQFLRWISILATLFFLIFKIFLFHHFYGDELKGMKVFKKIFTVFVEVLWILKYAIIHFSGVYLFSKHPLRTPVELNHLFRRTNCEKTLHQKLKKIQRNMTNMMKWTLSSLIIPSLFATFLPMFLEMALDIEYPWKTWDIELLNLLRLLYLRLISLPFLFYLIHISSLQILHFEEYIEVIRSPENTDTMDEMFQKYLKIHVALQESVKNYRLFLRVIFGVVVTWGTIYAYFAMGLYKTMMVKNENTQHYTILAFDYFAGFIRSVVETVALFYLPFIMLHRVEETEKAVTSKICEISYSKMPTTHSLNTLQKIFDFINQIEAFQKNELIGYQVFGGKLSRIKTIWLITLSPLALHIANSIIKGSL